MGYDCIVSCFRSALCKGVRATIGLQNNILEFPTGIFTISLNTAILYTLVLMSLKNSGPSAAAIRLMSDYKYLMEHSPEVCYPTEPP